MHGSRTRGRIRTALKFRSSDVSDSDHGHGHDDPNAAPMHLDVQRTFPTGAVVFCYLLAAAALIGGVITGLTIIVD